LNTVEVYLQFYELDGRWKGYDIFKWCCVTKTPPKYERFHARPLAHSDLSTIINFNKVRDWCWDMWGPSCDLKDYDRVHELSNYMSLAQYNDSTYDTLNEHWCWSNEEVHKQRRIYLAGDEERVWLETRWQ
jgi:hypothetical protein